jgi:hypothetical protein
VLHGRAQGSWPWVICSQHSGARLAAFTGRMISKMIESGAQYALGGLLPTERCLGRRAFRKTHTSKLDLGREDGTEPPASLPLGDVPPDYQSNDLH